MLPDFRFAFRMLLKRPGLTVVAALSIALGIAANTTVFCWIDAILLRPFPGVSEPGRLVVLCSTHGSATYDTVSFPDLKDYNQLKPVFAGVIGSQVTPACLTMGDKSEWIYGQIATANFFDVLGVKAALGRTFLPEEETKPGGHPVVVLSHTFWQNRFAGDPGIIGRVIELNRFHFTVVGVAPEGFRGSMSGLRSDFWAPLMMYDQVAHFGSVNERRDRWLHTMARLQPGVSLEQAQAAASVLAHQLEETYPGQDREMGMKLLPPYKSPWGGQSLLLPVLRILMVVSFGVLCIVAANVANLLLARASSRQKEMAVRLAMGAGRVQIVRQMMVESLLLALLGGALGVVLANWGTHLFKIFIPHTHLPIGYDYRLDWETLGFTVVLTVLTGLLLGLAPALQAVRANLNDALKEGGRTSSSTPSSHRLRSALVACEIALALLLLVGAGLCIKGAKKSREIDAGFEPSHRLLAGLRLGAHGYTEETGKVFYRQLQQRLEALPGVKHAALASWFPLGFEGGPGTGVNVPGYQRTPNEDTVVSYSVVSPGYFAAMGVPLRDGRDFRERDDAQSEPVVIINEALAQRFWRGMNPIGRKAIILGNRNATVIGIAKTGKYRSLSEPLKPFLYVPYAQGVSDLNLGIVLDCAGAPAGMAPAMAKAVHELDPGVEPWATITASDYVEAAFLGQSIVSSLLSGLGLVALALAAMGIYAVMAYSVSQRTHEIGVRMALGAQWRNVLSLVLGQGMSLAGVGALLGLGGAFAVTHLLASFLYGVSPFDLVTFGGVTLLLGLVSLVACFLPASRATRVDPVVALRYE